MAQNSFWDLSVRLFIIFAKILPSSTKFKFTIKMCEEIFQSFPFRRINDLLAWQIGIHLGTRITWIFLNISKLYEFQWTTLFRPHFINSLAQIRTRNYQNLDLTPPSGQKLFLKIMIFSTFFHFFFFDPRFVSKGHQWRQMTPNNYCALLLMFLRKSKKK